jgi:hypothetical protein
VARLLCPSSLEGAEGGRGEEGDRTQEGMAEANLRARWTIADTMAAFNSTLSTSCRNDLARDRRDEFFRRLRNTMTTSGCASLGEAMKTSRTNG